MSDTPMLAQLRASSRVVVVQPWMVRELGVAAVWFAQLLWHMETHGTPVVARGDHEWEDETGLGRAQVLRAKAKVIERGWITCEVRKIRGTPTSHLALVSDALEADLRAIHCPKSDTPGSRDNGQTSTNQMVLEVDGGEGASGEQSLPDFDAFWLAYPNPASKAAARTAYAKAVKIASPAIILEGAARYASEISGRDGFRGAHAATWLNQRRWEDPPGANASGRTPRRGAAAPVSTSRDGQAGRVAL